MFIICLSHLILHMNRMRSKQNNNLELLLPSDFGNHNNMKGELNKCSDRSREVLLPAPFRKLLETNS